MANNSIHDRYDRPALLGVVGEDLTGVRLLDLGGSIGEVTVHFLRRGATVTLADIDHEACDHARRIFGQYVKVDEFDLTVTPWPYDSGTFDVVVASLVLDLLADLSPLAEVTRVLRSGGRFVASVPHPHAVGDPETRRTQTFVRDGLEVERDWYVRRISTLVNEFAAVGLYVSRLEEPFPPADDDGVIGEPWCLVFELRPLPEALT